MYISIITNGYVVHNEGIIIFCQSGENVHVQNSEQCWKVRR